ncbi:adenylate kinase isoenzyme 1 isoform X2 [Sitodiplosis mosellana]|uniref:adenylate kinase isoenzyme 1 isoform X2 n=1 Tax=Sitodiplosis mosellana TaxID=263140 RepID=UPI0024451F94|nr:adenylate kinase isoenzyme 1 isoform X2 [Sitodiplosis mosellana]XP_055317916.1 adenylate kinase isoenzyme 1 isoform X2 [Sitodiplosis mosellana]XP_055317924.1 adenylate kinase isoenzyme 1 isoform X2 [Sitodiplosis mosellana]XP_055317933.1 adenylate kinase isoenzyme 1 isoform X2 [Sitodiplosis mosellana]
MASGDNVPVVWILGGPGSGKGTQCAKIVEKFGFSHFSTGDLLRAEVSAGSDKGKELAAIMKRGDLVPNEEVLDLLQKAMKEVLGKSKGFLIDGYPREKSQGVAFEKTIAPVDLIISLECTPETMVSRILKRAAESVEKRADDNEATIKNRIETFIKNTDEILIQYPTQTKRVNGERDVDQIFDEVSQVISEVVAKKS